MTSSKVTKTKARSVSVLSKKTILKMPKNPRIAEIILRVMGAHFDLVIYSEKLNNHTDNLLKKYGLHLDKSVSEMDPFLLADMCKKRADELSIFSKGSEMEPFERLSQEISPLLGLSIIEAELLRIALAAAYETDILRALDFIGEFSTQYTADLFANVIGVDSYDIYDVIETSSVIRDFEYCSMMGELKPSSLISLPNPIHRLIRKKEYSARDILAIFYKVAPPAELTMDDFGDRSQTVDVVTAFIKGVLAKPRQGVNILLYGKPGTGKTQFIRALAQHLNKTMVEVATSDSDGDPLQPSRRLKNLAVIQKILSANKDSFVLFDEVEDVFPTSSNHGNPFESAPATPDRNKGWLTRLLDETARPTVWICNSISQIDAAYLRRFDLIVEMQSTDKRARLKMVTQCFSEVKISSQLKAQLIQEERLSPGHLKKLSQVMGDLQHVDPALVNNRVEYLMSEMRKALKVPMKNRSENAVEYRPECVQCDTDLIALTVALQEAQTARICLYGPPGTGKTEWAKYMAKKINRPLLVKKASDLLGSYVGQTERSISKAFEEASRKNAVLLIDEADSFIRERSGMERTWEVSMVNQFLTSLEDFDGICVVSTNAMGSLDQAAMRRFDFKLKFEYLNETKVMMLFNQMLEAHEIDGDVNAVHARLGALTNLTPGDFAAIARKNRVLKSLTNPQSLVKALEEEVSYKPEAKVYRKLGFV